VDFSVASSLQTALYEMQGVLQLIKKLLGEYRALGEIRIQIAS
jgi:hypothetical protein